MFDHEQLLQLGYAFVRYVHVDIEAVHRKNIYISQSELATALKEARIDLKFMQERRPDSKGISEGKMAGALLFRLCKRRILNVNRDADQYGTYVYTQERAAISTALHFLRIDLDKCISGVDSVRRSRVPVNTRLQKLGKELLFQITSRHHNQESLGIFFESLCYIAEASGKIDALKSEILALQQARPS
jgi:hypothetical protein